MKSILNKTFILLVLATISTCLFIHEATQNIVFAKKAVPVKTRKTMPPQTYTQTTDNIAFVKNGWIYYLAKNTTQPVKIVKGLHPALSPDGKYISYITEVNENQHGGFFIINTETKEIKTIFPKERQIGRSIWSPKGDLIAYIDYGAQSNSTDLWIMNTDGTNKKAIYSVAASDPVEDSYSANGKPETIDYITWAPDGQSILFQDMFHVYQIGLDGKIIFTIPIRKLVGEYISETSTFVLNPLDLNVIAFSQVIEGSKKYKNYCNDGNAALFWYHLKTGQKKRLTPIDTFAIDPLWSADGKYIYFVGFKDIHREIDDIYRINSDGTGLIKIGKGEELSL